MSDRGDEEDVRVSRVDRDLADVVRVGEADVRPRLSGIGGLVQAIAVAHRIAKRRLATTDVHDVRSRRRDGESANGGNWL